MLTAGKSQTRVESRNSRVSIETLDFARVRTFHWHDWSWIAGSGAKGGGNRQPVPGAHRSIDIAGSGVPEMLQKGRGRGLQEECDQGSTMADRPSDATGQSVDIAGIWALKTVGSCRVSGAVMHVPKHRLGT